MDVLRDAVEADGVPANLAADDVVADSLNLLQSLDDVHEASAVDGDDEVFIFLV